MIVRQHRASHMSQEGARLEKAPRGPRQSWDPPAPWLSKPCSPKRSKLGTSAPLDGKAHPTGASSRAGASRQGAAGTQWAAAQESTAGAQTQGLGIWGPLSVLRGPREGEDVGNGVLSGGRGEAGQ